MFDSTVPFEEKAPNLENAESLRTAAEAYSAAGSAMGGITLDPTSVVVNGDEATVTYDVLFGVRPPTRTSPRPSRRSATSGSCHRRRSASSSHRRGCPVRERPRLRGGGPPPPIAGDAASFPSDAELARTLAASAGRATLSTLTADGYPFGSIVSIVVNDDGEPLMCISSLAEHTINARRDPGRAC